MNKFWRQVVLAVATIAAFAVPNVMIYQKERLLSHGVAMFLELAPIDPRSLMQGDYMALRYKVAQDAARTFLPPDGRLVVALDEKNVATFKRVYFPGSPLLARERLLRYRKRGQGISLGAESFFFQEGHAGYYRNAKYGELRVDESGESVLAGMRDQNLIPLSPVRRLRTQ